MASFFITEFGGLGYGNGRVIPAPGLPHLRSFAMDLSSASTGALGAGTNLIGVTADAGGWLLAGSSGSTAVATSTNGMRIPAATPPLYFEISPYARLTAVST